MKVALVSVSRGRAEYVGPADSLVGDLLASGCKQLGLNAKTALVVLGGKVLPTTARCSGVGISDGTTVLLLQQNPKPLFDPTQVSGLLTQLQLQHSSPHLTALKEMGFGGQRAELALLMNHQDYDAALNWLMDHTDEPDPPMNVMQCLLRQQCSFVVTGTRFQPQRYYQCFTCGTGNGEGVCEACRLVCHANCEVSESHWSDAFFCDCGSNGRFARKCKCNTKL